MPDDNADTGAAREAESRQMDKLMREPPKPGNGGMGADAAPVTAAEMAAAKQANNPHEQQAAPGVDDRSAQDMLADAVAAGDDGGQDSGGGEDPLKAAQAEAARWRELARKQEKRAKENAEKAKNFDAYTESQKTEQQRLADRAAEAERRAAEAEGRYHRTLAAATYDLPPSMIDQLGDGTEEEIHARAETLAAAINERAAVLAAAQAQASGGQQQAQPRNGAGFRPVESLRPGALPASESKPQDANAWLRAALAKKQ